MQNAHTRKTAYTFFCILQLIYKENFKTETKPQFFSKPNQNRTELEKSIPHIRTETHFMFFTDYIWLKKKKLIYRICQNIDETHVNAPCLHSGCHQCV